MKTNALLIRLSILVGIVVTSGSCKQTYTSSRPQKVSEKAHPVVLEKIETQTQATPITVSGTLASESERKLSFKIGGIIQRILAEEGQQVYAGQLLAVLDPIEINAQVSQAQNAFAKSERDLKRIEELYQEEAATLEQKQDLQTQHDISEAALKIAQYNQHHSRITAPVSGKILRRFAESDELVNPGTPIFSLAGTGQRTQVIRVGLSDTEIVQIAMGDSASVRFDAFPGRSFRAQVSEIGEASDPQSGKFEVELTLTGYHPSLKNGFIALAHIYPSRHSDQLSIPMNSLVEGDGRRARIFISKDQKTVESREVEVLAIQSEYFTIDDPDLDQAWVVTRGASYLAENDSIYLSKILNR